jgi:hypothetical protein
VSLRTEGRNREIAPSLESAALNWQGERRPILTPPPHCL